MVARSIPAHEVTVPRDTPTWSVAWLVVVMCVVHMFTETAVSVVSLLPGLFFTRNFDKILLPATTLLALISLISRRRFQWDAFSVFCFLLVPYGLALGIVAGGAPRFMVSHVFVSLMIPSLYLVGYNLGSEEYRLPGFLKRVSYTALWFGFGTFLLFSIMLQVGIINYAGFNSAIFLLPACFFLISRRYLLFFFTLFLVLIGGKRGILLSIAFVLFMFAGPFRTRSLSTNVIISVVAVASLAAASFLLEPYLYTEGGGGFFNAVLGKWFSLNPMRENYDPIAATSTRALELVLVAQQFLETTRNWVFGMGYGWSFLEIRIEPEGTMIERLHFMHLSAANFIALYGVFLGSVFLAFLASRLGRVGKHISQLGARHSSASVLFAFIVACVVWSMTAHVFASVPIFWLALGVLAGSTRWHAAGNLPAPATPSVLRRSSPPPPRSPGYR